MGAMSGHPMLRRRPLAAVGRWVMLLVALIGLMAMHGLSDHGVGGLAGSGAVRADATVAAPVAGASAEGTHEHERAQVGDSGSGSDGGHGGHGGLVIGLCLAVLAAVLVLAALVRGAGILGTLRLELSDVTRAVAAAVRARARGPGRPDLDVLSVRRC